MFKHMTKSRKWTLLIAAAVLLFCVAVLVAMKKLAPPSFFADTSPLRADGSEVNTPFFVGAVIAFVVILWALLAKKQLAEVQPAGAALRDYVAALAVVGDGHQGASAGGPATPRRKPQPQPAKEPEDVAEKLRLLEKIARMPDTRFQKIAEARRKIADGELETPAAIDATVRRLAEELGL